MYNNSLLLKHTISIYNTDLCLILAKIVAIWMFAKIEIQMLLVRVATEVIEKAEIEIAICRIACETEKGFER